MEDLRIGDARRCDLSLGWVAHHIELPLKGVFVGECTTSYKNLLNVGLRGSRHAADCGSVNWRIATAEKGECFLAHNALQDSLALQALMLFYWQECHAHAVRAGQRQFETQLTALPHKELVWDLEENAGAIARLRIASAGPAMRQVEQHLDSLAYDVVTLVAANAGHESDPAGVVLLRRMVQTLSGRRAIRFFQTCRHGHRLRRTPPLPDRLFLSWDFARKGCGGVAHSGSGTHSCRFLLTARRTVKYNSEFRYKGCKFQNYAWFQCKFSLILPAGRRIPL